MGSISILGELVDVLGELMAIMGGQGPGGIGGGGGGGLGAGSFRRRGDGRPAPDSRMTRIAE